MNRRTKLPETLAGTRPQLPTGMGLARKVGLPQVAQPEAFKWETNSMPSSASPAVSVRDLFAAVRMIRVVRE